MAPPGPFIVRPIVPSVPPPAITPLKVVAPLVGVSVNTVMVPLALLITLPPAPLTLLSEAAC